MKIVIRKSILKEISLVQAKERLKTKVMQKAIKSYAWRCANDKDETTKNQLVCKALLQDEDLTAALAKGYGDGLLMSLPLDLDSNQLGTSLNWLISLVHKGGPSFYLIFIDMLRALDMGPDRKIRSPLTDWGDLERKKAEGSNWGEKDDNKKYSVQLALERLAILVADSLSNRNQYLEKFFHYQQFMSEKDLNKIDSFLELARILSDADPLIQAYQNKKAYADAKEGEEKILDNDKWDISALHNKGAACELGKGTDWCTAAPGLNWFNKYYDKEDPLFYFLDKTTGEKYQISFGAEQYMNKIDSYMGDEKLDELIDLLASVEDQIKPEYEKAHYAIFKRKSITDLEYLKKKISGLKPEEAVGLIVSVARNPEASPEILTYLSDHDAYSVQASLAANPSTPPETLAKFANNRHKVIRLSLTDNPSTPTATLTLLLKDPDPMIRLHAGRSLKANNIQESKSFNLKIRIVK